jgi:hypothetical protein
MLLKTIYFTTQQAVLTLEGILINYKLLVRYQKFRFTSIRDGNERSKKSCSYMPTFPIYAGSSRFQALEKRNPDIPFGIAKILLNPDFQKISPVLRQLTLNFEPDFKIPRHFFLWPANRSREICRPLLFTCVAWSACAGRLYRYCAVLIRIQSGNWIYAIGIFLPHRKTTVLVDL